MNFLDLLFPRTCLECRNAGKYICSACLGKVEPAKLICPVCKKHSFYGKTHDFCTNKLFLDGLYCFYKYDGVIRKAILRIKYNFASSVAGELVENLNASLNIKNAVICPVPLHKKRENWRGFNQAAMLAKMFAKKLNFGYEEELILRLENTAPQARLGKIERMQNIRGKFAVNTKLKAVVANHPKIIIFDDVWTTGATISEIGKVLKQAGAIEVWGMSVARG